MSETFNSVLNIENFNIYDIIKIASKKYNIDVFRTLNGVTIHPNQYIIKDFNGSIFTVNSNIMVPVIKDFSNIIIRYTKFEKGLFIETTKNVKMKYPDGSVIEQSLELLAYIPLSPKYTKKILISYCNRNYYIYVEELKHEELMDNISLSTVLYNRSNTDIITDFDRIVFGNVSPRFDKELVNLTRYGALINYINNIIFTIKDPKYIVKLFKTGMNLLVPNSMNTCENSVLLEVENYIDTIFDVNAERPSIMEAPVVEEEDDDDEESDWEDEEDEEYEDDEVDVSSF